jgi:hypothetical protein
MGDSNFPWWILIVSGGLTLFICVLLCRKGRSNESTMINTAQLLPDMSIGSDDDEDEDDGVRDTQLQEHNSSSSSSENGDDHAVNAWQEALSDKIPNDDISNA